MSIDLLQGLLAVVFASVWLLVWQILARSQRTDRLLRESERRADPAAVLRQSSLTGQQSRQDLGRQDLGQPSPIAGIGPSRLRVENQSSRDCLEHGSSRLIPLDPRPAGEIDPSSGRSPVRSDHFLES